MLKGCILKVVGRRNQDVESLYTVDLIISTPHSNRFHTKRLATSIFIMSRLQKPLKIAFSTHSWNLYACLGRCNFMSSWTLKTKTQRDFSCPNFIFKSRSTEMCKSIKYEFWITSQRYKLWVPLFCRPKGREYNQPRINSTHELLIYVHRRKRGETRIRILNSKNNFSVHELYS